MVIYRGKIYESVQNRTSSAGKRAQRLNHLLAMTKNSEENLTLNLILK